MTLAELKAARDAAKVAMQEASKRKRDFDSETRALPNAERGLPKFRWMGSYYTGHGISTEDRLPKIGETIKYQTSGSDYGYDFKYIVVEKITDKSIIGSYYGTRGVMSRGKNYEVVWTKDETAILTGMQTEYDRASGKFWSLDRKVREAEEAEKQTQEEKEKAERAAKRKALVDEYLAVFKDVADRNDEDSEGLSDDQLANYADPDYQAWIDSVGRHIKAALWGAANAPVQYIEVKA